MGCGGDEKSMQYFNRRNVRERRFARPGRLWKESIEMDITEKEYKHVYRIHSVQERGQRQVF
jgi:hypothetical protein